MDNRSSSRSLTKYNVYCIYCTLPSLWPIGAILYHNIRFIFECQAVTWTDTISLSIGSLWKNFSEITFSLKYKHFHSTKCMSEERWSFIKIITHYGQDKMAAILQDKCIFLNGDVWNSIKIPLKIMVRRRRGAKPLSETMMIKLPTHICVTRPHLFDVISTWQL